MSRRLLAAYQILKIVRYCIDNKCDKSILYVMPKGKAKITIVYEPFVTEKKSAFIVIDDIGQGEVFENE